MGHCCVVSLLSSLELWDSPTRTRSRADTLATCPGSPSIPPATAWCSCPSLQWRLGNCHQTGSSHWSHDCYVHRSHDWVPGDTEMKSESDMPWWPTAVLVTLLVQNLTRNCEQGYENRCTFPKSSPVTSNFFSLDLQTALMSVPSEPSGQSPV